MRVVSWNCCQAFRKKWEYVDAYRPDLIVVPEAESIERQPDALLDRYPYRAWVGDNPSKGLLVLGSDARPFSIHEAYNPEHRYVLPLRVAGALDLVLIGVWTQRDKGVGYTQHLSQALEEYEPLFRKHSIVIGDFNANKMWDPEHRRDVTHSENVQWLEDHGLVSVYHSLTGEPQGEESAATHAFRRNPGNPFHIDYAFVSRSLMVGNPVLDVPPIAEWIGLSDHGPLVLDLDLRG